MEHQQVNILITALCTQSILIVLFAYTLARILKRTNLHLLALLCCLLIATAICWILSNLFKYQFLRITGEDQACD